MKTSKDRIKGALRQSGKSQSDLARKLGVNRAAVSEMLRSDGEAPLKYLKAVAEITDSDFEWLRTGVQIISNSELSELESLKEENKKLKSEIEVLRSALREIGAGAGGSSQTPQRNVG